MHTYDAVADGLRTSRGNVSASTHNDATMRVDQWAVKVYELAETADWL